jgi:hypothetical protein
MSRASVLLTVLVFAFTATAQRTPDRYERVLVPLYGESDGVADSRWGTRLWLHNEGSRPLDVFPMGPFCVTSFPCVLALRPYPSMAARETALGVTGAAFVPVPIANSDRAAPGVFFYVEREGAADLSSQLHVADTERRPLARGTRLPVVRESEFFTDETNIVGVPLMDGTRVALRIYDREAEGGAVVRIRALDAITSQVLGEEDITFVHAAKDSCAPFDATGCPAGFVYKPAFVQITDLLARFPELTPSVDRLARLSIEVEPRTPGLAFWPMVSVTDNATSEVTIYTAR